MRKITEQRYHVTFKENMYHIYQERQAIARGDFDENLFYKLRTIEAEALTRVTT